MNPTETAGGSSGRDFYARLYATDLAMEAEWLRRGAVEKANSVEQLLRRRGGTPPTPLARTLVELGCGTGALIQECKRRGLAREYVAIDWSEDALRHLRESSRGIEVRRADVTAPDFALLADGGSVDVLLLSHVLEHLEQPRAFLESIVARIAFEHLIVEVPLEDLPLARWRGRADRAANRAGHVQFFTAATFTALLRAAGLEIVATRRYVPILDRETLRFLAAKNGFTPAQHFRRFLSMNLIPRLCRTLWSRLYVAHFAALCRKRPPAG